MGVKAKSGESVVSDGSGVWKTRTIQRRPLDERWNRSAIDFVKHFPWDSGKDTESRIEPERSAVKMKDDDVTAERNQVVHQETTPRNFHIKTKDLHGQVLWVCLDLEGDDEASTLD